MGAYDEGKLDGLTPDERRDLREEIEGLRRGQEAVLVYDSNRSNRPQRIPGTVGKEPDDDRYLLRLKNDERKGDLVVRDCRDDEDMIYGGFGVRSTGARYTNRNTRVGYLTEVEVADD